MQNELNIYKEKSKNSFDKKAKEYSTTHDGKFVAPMYNEVLKRVLSLNPKNFLDIGCGPGTILSYLKKYDDIRLYGLDISDKMIEEAKKKYRKKSRISSWRCRVYAMA